MSLLDYLRGMKQRHVRAALPMMYALHARSLGETSTSNAPDLTCLCEYRAKSF